MARRSESFFLVAGLALAGYALWGLMSTQVPAEQATAATLPPVPTTAAPEPPVTEVVEVVEAPPPPPDVDGVSDAISNVLGDNGHTELVPRSELVDSLPESVVSVLIDHGAVLEIADVPADEVRP
jgi:hypothetical protein